jgi:hypothetical protein
MQARKAGDEVKNSGLPDPRLELLSEWCDTCECKVTATEAKWLQHNNGAKHQRKIRNQDNARYLQRVGATQRVNAPSSASDPTSLAPAPAMALLPPPPTSYSCGSIPLMSAHALTEVSAVVGEANSSLARAGAPVVTDDAKLDASPTPRLTPPAPAAAMALLPPPPTSYSCGSTPLMSAHALTEVSAVVGEANSSPARAGTPDVDAKLEAAPNPPAALRCLLCDLQTSDPDILQEHFSGKTHEKNAAVADRAITRFVQIAAASIDHAPGDIAIDLPTLPAGRGLFAGFVNKLLYSASLAPHGFQAEMALGFSEACTTRNFSKDSVLNSILWRNYLLAVSQGTMADLLSPAELLPAVDSDDGGEGDEGDSADSVESDSAGACARGVDLD